MNEFERAREDYENIPIPEELSQRVSAGIRRGRRAHRRRVKSRIRRALTAAACFVLMVAVLNLSPTAAHAAAGVPVLGRVFRVLTFVSYERQADEVNYSVSIPRVEETVPPAQAGSEAEPEPAGGSAAERVNALIQEAADRHLEQARRDWDDYREAFFATGGTQEQWGDRQMDVIVDYEVLSQTDTRLSFYVRLAKDWVTASEERYYYNLDLANDRELTLRDVLGEDWVSVCNDAITREIDESVSREGYGRYFEPSMGGFSTVDEDTMFYIRGDGVPVAVFPPYSVSPGAYGFVEFPIE